ncbi:hypothetical protein M0208_05605 [Sphingomonas sp. SUN019]|uniref:hypothetical protein n=1 Tax=Sphingomonas sp. SUN019 TaxID=2937788 RepID=UPI002164D79E|nr:hypothetical protein [Sphingomonas sp. SUN019]UVO50019.1 hypothetical protein M0208_05605 [Sphingomonas sp. SUN019]
MLLSLGLFAVTPALAQDMPGAVDLGALSRTQVQSSMADGYAERGGARSTVRAPNGLQISAKSRAYCESVPGLSARYGPNSPRVTRLAAACRQAGYRY